MIAVGRRAGSNGLVDDCGVVCCADVALVLLFCSVISAWLLEGSVVREVAELGGIYTAWAAVAMFLGFFAKCGGTVVSSSSCGSAVSGDFMVCSFRFGKFGV